MQIDFVPASPGTHYLMALYAGGESALSSDGDAIVPGAVSRSAIAVPLGESAYPGVKRVTCDAPLGVANIVVCEQAGATPADTDPIVAVATLEIFTESACLILRGA